MHVGGPAEHVRRERCAERIEIVDGDAVRFHNLRRGGVILQLVADETPRRTLRDDRRARPDQRRAGALQKQDKFVQVPCVLIERHRQLPVDHVSLAIRALVAQIVQPPVEMDRVPFRFAEPVVQQLQTDARVLTVAFVMLDGGFPVHDLDHVRRVAHGDGIADEEDFALICCLTLHPSTRLPGNGSRLRRLGGHVPWRGPRAMRRSSRRRQRKRRGGLWRSRRRPGCYHARQAPGPAP